MVPKNRAFSPIVARRSSSMIQRHTMAVAIPTPCTNTGTTAFFSWERKGFPLDMMATIFRCHRQNINYGSSFMCAGTPGAGARKRALGDTMNAIGRDGRSEEHTSELQSHVNLVCRLL